jgi:hypothetical protein
VTFAARRKYAHHSALLGAQQLAGSDRPGEFFMRRCDAGKLVLAVAGLALALSVEAGRVKPPNEGEPDMVPTGKGWGEVAPGGKGKRNPKLGGGTNGIAYHGGPVMLSTPKVFYIWYGGWNGNTATTILTDLAQNIGSSPYFNINTTYFDGSNRHVTGAISYGGSMSMGYTYGTALSDNEIQQIVADAVASQLPKDTNGVYFVLTSADVSATSGFCTQYCGWHASGNIAGSDIKYAFVGNPDRCPNACEEQTIGPNGNAGADGMASIIAHELEESVTDPDLNAWYDRRGMENADKCAWTFGSTYATANGALANMKLGPSDYLIQRNWVNASGGFCAQSYP